MFGFTDKAHFIAMDTFNMCKPSYRSVSSADGQYITLKGVAAGSYLIASKQTGSPS
jgi:hypothetical protein